MYLWVLLVNALLLTSCGDLGRKGSSLSSRSDVEKMTITSDGLYEVLCKDGRTEVVTEDQFLNGLVCLPLPPESKTFCGRYSEPQHIEEGTHIVTCHTIFDNIVTIDAGAKILADDSWNLWFRGLKARGTAEKPITFGVSETSRSETWGEIEIATCSYHSVVTDNYVDCSVSEDFIISIKDGYTSGNIAEHVNFLKVGRLEIYETYVGYSNIVADKGVFLKRGSYLRYSNIKTSNLDINDSYLLNSEVKAEIVDLESSLLVWNNFLGTRFLGSSKGSAVIAFSIFDEISYVPAAGGLYFVSNHIKNDFDISIVEGTYVYDLSKDGTFKNEKLIFPFPFKNSYNLDKNETLDLKILALDRSGKATVDPKIITKGVYHINGERYQFSKMWSDSSPQIAFDQSESYRLHFSLDESEKEKNWSPKIEINVW